MVELRKFDGKKVALTDIDGDVFVGYVCAYFEPEDNPPEFNEEAIALENPIKNKHVKYSNPVCFNATDIISIRVID